MPAHNRDIALVFAGGGAKGAYQIGVWKAMHELGLDERIGAVAGSSVGAINALLFSTIDVDVAEAAWRGADESDFLAPKEDEPQLVERMTNGIRQSVESIKTAYETGTPSLLFEPPFDPLRINGIEIYEQTARLISNTLNEQVAGTMHLPPGFTDLVSTVAPRTDALYRRKLIEGLYSNHRLRELLRTNIPEDAPFRIPTYATVYDLEKCVPVYRRIDRMAPTQAIEVALASAAMPGVFAPMVVGGLICCDGGVGDNRPLMPLYKTGWRKFIVVHLSRLSKAGADEVAFDRESFPEAQLVTVLPNESFDDSFRAGTLNATPKAMAMRIDMGYDDAMRQFGILKLL